MSNETPENESTTNNIELEMINRFNTILTRIDNLIKRIEVMEQRFTTTQQEHTQTLRTVMVGWNGFLKSAEAQLRAVFKGNMPNPIKMKLIQMAFKGMDEAERRGK